MSRMYHKVMLEPAGISQFTFIAFERILESPTNTQRQNTCEVAVQNFDVRCPSLVEMYLVRF